MHVGRTVLRQGNGSLDLVLVFGSDETRSFEELGRGIGIEDIDFEMMFEWRLMATVLDLCRWRLTDGLGCCCHH